MQVRRHNRKGKRELYRAAQWGTSGKKCKPEWKPVGRKKSILQNVVVISS